MKKWYFTGRGLDHVEISHYREELFAEFSGRRIGYDQRPLTHYNVARGEVVAPLGSSAQECCEIGVDLIRLGYVDAGVEQFARACELDPASPIAHSFYIIGLDYSGADPARRIIELKRWAQKHADGAGPFCNHDNDADPDRQIRVGYLSGDFYRHSAFNTIYPLIRNHDRERFHVTCYYTGPQNDDYTMSARNACDEWRPVYTIDDEQLLQTIRADAIDVLVDLSGHTSGNRLRVFARRPAPIQLPAFGFVEGNGLRATTHVWGDQMLLNTNERAAIGRPVLDLPTGFVYEPPGDAPDVSDLPSLWGEPFTFGCFNKIDKINDAVLALWARVLEATPGSRLLLKDQWYSEFTLRRQLASRMERLHIDLSRVTLLGPTQHRLHMECFDEVDVALDPFPHGGGTSSAEALYMGVPVITKFGHTPPGRATAAMQFRAGLAMFIANTEDEYVTIAREISQPKLREHLNVMRRNMRARLLATPLCNINVTVRAVEQHYAQVWRQWCASRKRGKHSKARHRRV